MGSLLKPSMMMVVLLSCVLFLLELVLSEHVHLIWEATLTEDYSQLPSLAPPRHHDRPFVA